MHNFVNSHIAWKVLVKPFKKYFMKSLPKPCCKNFSINVKSWPSKNISWNNTASFSKAFIKSFFQRLCKKTCNISLNIMERCWKHFWKICFYSDRIIQETFSKPCKNISRKVIRKPFKKVCLKYYEKVSKIFRGKIFLWNWKCKKIFPKPCKNISRKVIRKPFKKNFCIIAWNVLATFLQRFGHGIDIVETHFKKC